MRNKLLRGASLAAVSVAPRVKPVQSASPKVRCGNPSCNADHTPSRAITKAELAALNPYERKMMKQMMKSNGIKLPK